MQSRRTTLDSYVPVLKQRKNILEEIEPEVNPAKARLAAHKTCEWPGRQPCLLSFAHMITYVHKIFNQIIFVSKLRNNSIRTTKFTIHDEQMPTFKLVHADNKK